MRKAPRGGGELAAGQRARALLRVFRQGRILGPCGCIDKPHAASRFLKDRDDRERHHRALEQRDLAKVRYDGRIVVFEKITQPRAVVGPHPFVGDQEHGASNG
ncbi:hypothetical protein SDC9_103340 [bioreactor metagenome]|uniref:Uncharacterized protein n=1 Tax=bioreactor metagenome TaxID=1076179 RepID=A0A645B483_9ZZZZ